jgi:hypothetical protein
LRVLREERLSPLVPQASEQRVLQEEERRLAETKNKKRKQKQETGDMRQDRKKETGNRKEKET